MRPLASGTPGLPFVVKIITGETRQGKETENGNRSLVANRFPLSLSVSRRQVLYEAAGGRAALIDFKNGVSREISGYLIIRQQGFRSGLQRRITTSVPVAPQGGCYFIHTGNTPFSVITVPSVWYPALHTGFALPLCAGSR